MSSRGWTTSSLCCGRARIVQRYLELGRAASPFLPGRQQQTTSIAVSSPPPGGALNVSVVTFAPQGTNFTDDVIDETGQPDGGRVAGKAPGMHRTDTIDVIFVLEGEVVLWHDDGIEQTSAARRCRRAAGRVACLGEPKRQHMHGRHRRPIGEAKVSPVSGIPESVYERGHPGVPDRSYRRVFVTWIDSLWAVKQRGITDGLVIYLRPERFLSQRVRI